MSDAASTAKSDAGSKPEASAPRSAPGLPSTMPAATSAMVSASKAALESDAERNEVFTSLVTSDEDIVGLVAYSIYKQNKHDWLVSFNRQKNREPDEAELESYIIGESTPRRLAIYRHLAVATLEGRGPQVNAGPSTEKFTQRALGSNAKAMPAQQAGGQGNNAMTWVIALVVAVGAVLLAGKYGLPGMR